MRRRIAALILAAVWMLSLAACGRDAEETTPTVPTLTAGETLELENFRLSASTWSSPNGATIHLTATPNGYAEGQSAAFVVRLEGEEVENVPCDWTGGVYTASAELNAADGYCYYVVLTSTDGTQTEVEVNTPTSPTDEALINLASSLESYCSLTVESFTQDGSKLTLTQGSALVQAPRITNNDEAISCSEAALVLIFNDEEVSRTTLTLTPGEESGAFTASLADVTLELPQMEDDQQVSLRLEVTLSNGQSLSASGAAWWYMDGQLLSAVG